MRSRRKWRTTRYCIERRKALHEQTAQAIESSIHDRLEEHYSELAHHYSRSGNTQKAVEYLQLAGQQAVQRSANAEAITHLTTALELLKTLPDTPERVQQELALQTTLGPALVATKGIGAPEVEEVYTRARELCQQIGDTPQLFPRAVGTVDCLCSAGGAAGGAGVGGAAPQLGPERPRPSPPPTGPLYVGGHLVMARRVVSCPSPFGAGHHSLRPSTAPLLCYSL